MKNIAIMTHSLNGGGAERIAGLLSKELSRFYNVYVFVLSAENIVYEYGGQLVVLKGEWPFLGECILEAKKKYQIDVSISFLVEMNAWNVRTRWKEKVILSERSARLPIEPKLYAEEWMIKKWYGGADEIVACSEGVRWELEQIYHTDAPVSVIYNFNDTEMIRRKSKERMPGEITEFLGKSGWFVNVGRLHKQKNQEWLIKEFAWYSKQDGHDEKLLIVGSGELEGELRTLVQELKLEDKVRILPYCENPFCYIKGAIALINTSRYEGLSNVIIEAFALGCPVIATDCLAGSRELLNDWKDYGSSISDSVICKRGILVPQLAAEGDGSHHLAEAMEKIQEQGVRRRIIQNELDYMRDYGNERLLHQWLDVIEKEMHSEKKGVFSDEEILDNAKHIIIYGAGNIGKICLSRLNTKYRVEGFAVSKRENAGMNMYGLPVRAIEEYANHSSNYTILVGTGWEYRDEIVQRLMELGFPNILFPW